jgi:hypothetical protein
VKSDALVVHARRMQAGIGSTSWAREIATVMGNMICAQALAVMMLEISVAIVAMIRYKENPP